MKPVLSIIVAIADGNAIGRDGNLLFYISDDLKHFKQLTIGHPVIMGRKTFESLPKGALPGRRNIVLTHNNSWNAPGAETFHSLPEAVNAASNPSRMADDCSVDPSEIFIIGGAEIYKQALPLAERLYITRIFAEADAPDTFFPDFENEWEIESESPILSDTKTDLKYRFRQYKRKEPVSSNNL